MMELPEAVCSAAQLDKALAGRGITGVVAAQSPHGFAWYNGDPAAYDGMLRGRTIRGADGFGNYVRIRADGAMLVLGEGIRIRLLGAEEKRPAKHQLLVELEGDAALVCSVQMYGGMWAHETEGWDNPYYQLALEKPSPLTDAFDAAWFDGLWDGCPKTLSAKAFLATEQRVPGLGNGVLQDILWGARIHPKTKLVRLDDGHRQAMYESVKATLADMTEKGGRDTEKDVFGWPGGYKTKLSAKTVGGPCPACGGLIQKQAYMGGSIYFCPTCQPLLK